MQKSLRDPFSPFLSDFDMEHRHLPAHEFVRFQKRLSRRASRHIGAARAVAEGLAEARLELGTPDLATLWVLVLALWVRNQAEKTAAWFRYCDSPSNATWESCVPLALGSIDYLAGCG